MCGIGGVINYDKSSSQELLNKILSKIEHRGRFGTLYETYNSHALNFAIGTNRLPIVKPELNKQPAISPNSTIILVMNGEIFNYKDIALKLKESYGINFKDSLPGDTMILAAAIEQWGVDKTLKEITWEGVFVAIDLSTKRVFLARDHIGIKPLYYLHKNNQLFFASEIKALKDLTKQAIITQLDPGTFGIYNLEGDNSINIKSWWKPENLTIKNNLLEGYIKNRVYDLLNESVRLRVPSEGKYAILLSGGVDSSIILKLSLKYNKKIVAYTLYNNASSDLPYAKKLCNDLSVELVEVEAATSQELQQDLPSLINTLETWEWQVINHSAPMNKLFKKIREDGHKIVLTGEGADEIFFGYDHYSLNINFKFLEKERIKRVSHLHKTNCLRLDRMSMSHSLETRVPFLDRALVDFALTLPANKCISENLNKKPIRDIAREILPKEFFDRKKMSFARGVGYKYGQGDIQSVFGKIDLSTIKIKNKDWESLPRYPLERLFLSYFLKYGYGIALHLKNRSC